MNRKFIKKKFHFLIKFHHILIFWHAPANADLPVQEIEKNDKDFVSMLCSFLQDTLMNGKHLFEKRIVPKIFTVTFDQFKPCWEFFYLLNK